MHSGNILLCFSQLPIIDISDDELNNLGLHFDDGLPETKITDFGLSQFINNPSTLNPTNVCGVLPYIAPEIISGKPYTKANDIIMVEITTEKPPYG